ncbi:hypothetical protein FACS189420_0230 [Bacteroidia bacterium]|nr:hypothetical protein FACS189420_0230 [Bacteroidia bacterium]
MIIKPKISVIVPVYNVELYLCDCLNSILCQTFTEFELILIDDGSIDRSSEIIKDFAAKDARIKTIAQSNRGLSATRNTGISVALGEYILFVDSDDMIVYNALEILYQQAIENGADLVKGGILLYYSNGVRLPYSPRDKSLNNTMPIPGHIAYRETMEMNNFHPESCLFFIKRDIIVKNEIFFKEGILHEDELWAVKATFNAEKVLLIDFNYYLYRQREGSIMRSSNNIMHRIQSLFEVAKELNAYIPKLRAKNIPEESITQVYKKIFWLYHFIHSLLYKNKTIDFSCREYFSDILTTVYPTLSYVQQRYCLTRFCLSQFLYNTR